MPNNSAWTTSLSGTNGWADMFQAYRGAGVPTSGEHQDVHLVDLWIIMVAHLLVYLEQNHHLMIVIIVF